MEEENIIVATAANYWISPSAITITLNALGEPNRIQCSVAGGAQLMVYIRGVKAVDHEHPEYNNNGDGLEYDVAHNYRHWPMVISPTYFNSNSRKYLYVAVPKTADVGTTAQVVFPSELLDIYGYPVEKVYTTVETVNLDGSTQEVSTGEYRRTSDTPAGSDSYFYIWLQGIISSSGDDGQMPREWEQVPDSGYLNSDEAYSTTETEWYKWEPISGTVTFLKNIWMSAESWFQNLQVIDGIVKGEFKVQGLLDAIKAKIDSIQSHNFVSGLLDGSGWRLTSDNGDGGSELEVDFLKVRKKATFMELEIRKETFVGGNQNYSPAGSVLYRVDYMDEHDEALGYSVMKVPFLLKKFAFLGNIFNYAARKRVRRAMSPEEWRNVHHFRCYLLADDGTTATRNWWRVGDQPRCQSFNKAASAKAKQTWNAHGTQMDDPSTPMEQKDYTGQPIETAYYWRLVSNTGAERLDDGHVYDYIDMPYEGWHGYDEHDRDSFRDPGSGIPVAGDTIVCMGSRVEEDRMNMVSIQTTGAENDPPAIKGYRGIHTFSLANEDNRVFCISPKEFLVKSQVFRLLDDSGYEFRVPLERGMWQKGLRYHYYDRVSWAGSIWLCIVSDTYVWEDAGGHPYSGDPAYITDIEVGEGEFQYTAVLDGETYTGYDHYYKAGKYNGTTYYYIRLYTYSEPSRSNNLWVREVSKGTEITETVIHYAASLSGIDHPNDDSDDWKTTIEATGILAGQYLWTRTTVYYDDPNDPDREPTRTYSVARWGIDGDGISEINSYYLATENNSLVITSANDKPNDPDYPIWMPSDSGYASANAQHKWFDTFSDCAAANGGVGAMQGWLVWEKTVITYDMAPNPDGTPVTKPDLINYKSSRIGQDGQIGEEEYYCLREYDTYDKAFPAESAFPWPWEVGINWLVQMDPASENWRLVDTDSPNQKICTEQSKAGAPWYQTTHYPNCPVWSPTMPAYDDSTPAKAKKKYLWNFEQRIDGQGTEYATKPICIGDHSRGIVGVLELYALSAGSGPQTTGRHIPDDVWKANGNSETDYQHPSQDPKDTLKTWSDEVYDRAPTEALPYQWNWTRTLYNQPKYPGGKIPASLGGGDEPTDPKTGKWYEDHYHVSAVRGTKGEDGAGVEYIYCRTADANPPQGYLNRAGNVTGYGHIEADETVTIGGKTYPRCRYDNDFVPDPTTVSGMTYTWTDNPRGITQELPYEWVCERKSQSYMLDGNFAGGHIWSEFSAPKEWSKWGYNGQDGDGTEYVFIRTKDDTPPVLLSADGGTAGDYQSQEWRPYVDGTGRTDIDVNDGTTAKPRCSDNPKGTSRDWPYEWVAKRTMAAAATSGENQGHRVWKSYYESVGSPYKLSKWSTYSSLRLDIDNEMDMVPTESDGTVKAAYTVSTVVHLYDGATEIDLSGTTISFSGGPAATIATASQASEGTGKKGRKLSWAFIAGQTMADAYEITITYTYNGVTYTAVFTIAASKGQRIYQLSPLYSSLNCPRNANNTLDNPPALSLAISRIDGDKTTVVANPTANATYKDGDVTLTVKYNTQSMPTSASSGLDWPKANSLQVDAGGTVTNVYFALFNSSGVLLDRETVPVIRDGINGKSITKVGETHSYGVNESETTPPSVDGTESTAVLNKWYGSRDKVSPLWTQGRWLWVKTYITWSDDSHTTLYTNERNPNDGIKGQDIIVDGSTEMKYYVGDSNTTHPAEDSSDWKDISQVTQTKGKWLWSKATTWYRKAGSAAGSKDAGKSVNYNVSYIAKDGETGRAVTGTNIYYTASASKPSTPSGAPTPSGWADDGNTLITNANSAKHLYESTCTTYSDGTYSWTTPIDDGLISDMASTSEEFALADSNTTAPTSGWAASVTPTAGKWIWSRTKLTFKSGDPKYINTQCVGYCGTNGANGRAVSKITEYYKASNKSSGESSSSGTWTTDVNTAMNNWGESKKYLWNYEAVEYTESNGSKTTVNTDPQILAIWTKDGAAGTGIDSIVNWYKITTSATPPSKPSTPGADGWDDDPTAPGKGEYLWNYEVITWINPSNTTETDVQLIGYVGEDAVDFTIECADTIKPGDTALAVSVKRSEGTDIQTKTYKAANTAWGVTLQRSITPSTSSATVDLTNSRVTLSGIVATTQLTLILQKNGQNVATKVIRAVADGGTGATGHVGRWYYYAGVYDGTPGHYKMEKTRSPFVKQSATSNNFWMLDFQGVEPEGHEKTATVGPTASGQTEWTSMLATFQYIITEAVFSNFAKLGSFIINDDWMISKSGILYGNTGAAHPISPTESYSTYNVNNAYTKFDPAYPNTSKPDAYNFCPNFAVDGLTGKTYQNDAYLKGQIEATSGQITGTMTVGTYGSGNNSIRLLTSDTNGAAVKGFAGTTQKFNLGFYNGGPRLTMGSGYYDEHTVWFIDDNGASAIFAIDSSGTPYVQLLRKVNGASKWIRLEISSGGVGKIESNCWPSRSEVSKNQVYVQTESDYDGILRVRLRD